VNLSEQMQTTTVCLLLWVSEMAKAINCLCTC